METPAPIPGADDVAVEGFLKDVLRSGLLERDGLQAALRGVARDQRNDTNLLADHLVRGGHLSRFQARRLLRGKWRGLILGPYQVLAPIGRGGMGTVFLARDSRSGELLALKVLRRSASAQRQRERFRREMQLSRRVDHPHLAATYASGKIDGVYFIAMEYIPGKSLQRLVQADGALDVPRAARLLSEVALGLDHAHARGMIHRDLKPSNIMVTPHDHAKVLDLGLAMIEGEDVEDVRVLGGKGYIVGTMDYIAPEQTANAAAVDRRADIYSLGCTLYYAVTGRPPFPGGTAKEKIQRQRREEPESLLELKPTLPLPFVLLIRRLMAKDPADRPPTAAEVVRKLRPWAGDAELPLDRRDDPEYTSAVYALQADFHVDGNGAPPGSPRDSEELASEWPAADEITADTVPPPSLQLADGAYRDRNSGSHWWRSWQLVLFWCAAVLAATALMGFGALLAILVMHR